MVQPDGRTPFEQWANPYVQEISPYIPGKPIEEVQRELGLDYVVKLASNENPLGPSPKAILAAKKALETSNLYPDASWYHLRERLTAEYGFAPDYYLCGAGAVEILYFLAIAYLKPGDDVVIASPSFAMFPVITQMMGAHLIRVPLKNYRADLDAIAQAITSKTRLIFLDNPNNPVGTVFHHTDLVRLLDNLPDGVLVVSDEAYIHFVSDPDYPDSFQLLRAGYPLVILRTLSKVVGLAGLRVGFAISHPPIIATLFRVTPPFNVSRVAQAAAIAAFEDTDFIRASVELIHREKQFLYDGFADLGLEFVKSEANFILTDLKMPSSEAFPRLLQEGIIVRPAGPLLPTMVRITVGLRADNERLLEALSRVIVGEREPDYA
ncbi:MAG: histidinol-phosphate transaminase [bacterium JZ-2024 1]